MTYLKNLTRKFFRTCFFNNILKILWVQEYCTLKIRPWVYHFQRFSGGLIFGWHTYIHELGGAIIQPEEISCCYTTLSMYSLYIKSSSSFSSSTGCSKKKETFLTFDINLLSAKTYKHVVSKESLENCTTGHISFDSMVWLEHLYFRKEF